jgi:hypothetical protein
MYCQGCGQEILISSAFCPGCGTKAAAQKLSDPALRTSTVAHGRSFEQQVAQWLEVRLGHRVVQLNEWVKCASDLKPFECDVHTQTSIPFWDKAQRIGLVLFVLGVLLVASGTRDAQQISGPLLLFGSVLVVISKIKQRQRNYHVWVECKNLGKKVNRDHISKLHATTDRLRQNRDAEWSPDFVLCFSSTDFERDALAIAKRHRIACYRKSGNGFSKV